MRDAYLNIVEKDYMGWGMRLHGFLGWQGMHKLRKLRTIESTISFCSVRQEHKVWGKEEKTKCRQRDH